MRIVKVGVLAPTNKGIPLGVQGENRATQVEFDTRPWFREYPSGTVSAVARRNGDPAPYPMTLDVEDGTAVWLVSDTDTAKAGEGAVELTMTSGGARVRSLAFKTLVTASLTDSPVDDDAWYGWLDKAVVKVDETVQSAQRKMEKVDNEWTGIKVDVGAKVEELGEVAAKAADDAHHAKVDAQATAKALESAEGSVAKAEAAATRAEGAVEQAYGAAGQASVSAGNASAAASDAREASVQAEGWADRAENSATRAAASEANAALSASSAADSAENATAQKVAAENAKDAAESFKAGAEAAKGEAATSASNAATSATAAAKSASDAAASVGAINVIAPKTVYTAAIAEGYKALAMGDESSASGQGGVGCGYKADASGFESVAIGDSATSGGNSAVAIGILATANDSGSIALGAHSVTSKIDELSIGAPATETFAEYTREITHVSTPTADTSASNKKYTDDNDTKTLSEAKKYTDANDTKTLSEAKKYTDANTSNALVGTVSGKMMHVEDSWPGKPLGLTIDGAYKQDGTPSPENPVPITVIENPVINVTGKNLLDCDKGLNRCFTKNADGTYTITKISDDKRFSAYIPIRIPRGVNVYLSVTHMSAGVTGSVSIIFDYADGKHETSQLFPRDITAYFSEKDVRFMRFYVEGKVAIGESFTFLPQIEYGTEATAYKPYAGATLPITLPADHPYLAALPGGTHDNLVVRDGRVSVNCVLCSEVISDVKYIGNSESFQYVQVGVATGKPIDGYTHFICNRFIAGGRYAGGVYVAGGVNAMFFFCFQLGTFQDSSEAAAWFAANPTTVVYMDANGAKTIDLGKLDIPSLPETISNVWTDAELTTNMSMTYKRDINVAFENLVQAVVASAAGE